MLLQISITWNENILTLDKSAQTMPRSQIILKKKKKYNSCPALQIEFDVNCDSLYRLLILPKHFNGPNTYSTWKKNRRISPKLPFFHSHRDNVAILWIQNG